MMVHNILSQLVMDDFTRKLSEMTTVVIMIV